MEQELENESLDSAFRKIREYLEKLKSTELNIAVTGETGKGKSTFINAIRGLRKNDIGSAPTGVVETTMEPTAYPYPKYPNVKLWDLPGIGTENFKADPYLKLVGFDRYDFFIIISERFTSNDANLAREIQRMGKRFYFIRSKIDQSLYGEKMANETTFNEEYFLDLMRKDCITGLEKLNMKSPEVFLVSSFNLGKYDFHKFQETMEKEMPEHTKNVFLLALPNITRDIIEKKKNMLEANIWKMALMSGGVAAVPFPALGFGVDVLILMREIHKYLKAFGLDEASLKSLSKHAKVPVEVLKKATMSGFIDEITRDKVIKLLMKVAGVGLMVADNFLSAIPVIGSMVAGGISFCTTYRMLKLCLDQLAQDAHRVLLTAFPSAGKVDV
ncbi:hypothetical protein SKAU_G00140580 [Synaphobranchus kaupii]|uniref:IRG-type G domain-containing protein n=1 Tax=Synaphobranchus kaupii TaxID=118154 RepID=A0A9Q1FS80_SYNKA|nr:hypothetical protein SKAU_G00140580 [Synaphobranchus kaupii]